MNCPYCAKEMETGYLRGGSGYAPSPTSAAPAARSFWTSKNKKALRIS